MLQIIAESSCDLSHELAGKHHIKMVSATLKYHGEVHNDIDYEGRSLDEFYKTLNAMNKIPHIEAPDAEKYVKVFADGTYNGITEFIVFTVSSKIHGAYRSAVEAKEKFLANNRVHGVRIHIVDTLGSSHGCAYLVLKAAMMFENGAKYDELVAFSENYKIKVKHYLAVKDLSVIKKAGKMSIFALGAGKLLNIIPILTFNATGHGIVVNKFNSTDIVRDFFVHEFKNHANLDLSDFVIIGYTSNIEYAYWLKDDLRKHCSYEKEIYIMQVRPATGSVVGDDALSIFYMQDDAGTATISSFREKTKKMFKKDD